MLASPMNFYQRAAALGHSEAGLKQGQAITTTISVPDVHSLKSLVDQHVGVDDRQRLGDAALAPIEDASESAIHSRVLAFLAGRADLHPEDEQRIAAAFPVTVTATSVPDKTIDSVWELGTSQSGMVIVNVGTLTFNNGGAVAIRNSLLQFTVDQIVNNGRPPKDYQHFNILGVTGTTGAIGDSGGTGGVGRRGGSGACPSKNGDGGIVGGDGPQGGEGGPGGNGLPSMQATITINKAISGSAGPIVVFTQSGAGGTGGRGGVGGTGGPGGPGGDGVDCGCDGTSGGPGGPGGPAGRGGPGGPGGKGVDAKGNVVVKLPPSYLEHVVPLTADAPAGLGGKGGPPGTGGSGGSGGGGGKHRNGGGPGGPGGGNQEGVKGADNTQVGKPAVITILPT